MLFSCNKKECVFCFSEEDKIVYNALRFFYKTKDKTNIAVLEEGLWNMIFKDIYPEISNFKRIKINKDDNTLSYIFSESAFKMPFDNEGIYGKVTIDDNELLNILPLTYSFYKINSLAESANYAKFGGSVIYKNGFYYIKSDNIAYLDFLEKIPFLTGYKEIIPDLSELNKISQYEMEK